MKKVLIIDDHDIVRFGLQTLINTSRTCQVVDTQPSLLKGIEAVVRYTPDLVVCDLSLEDSKGLATVRAIVQAQNGRPVLIVSMHDEMIYAEQTLALGVSGYLMKEHAQEWVLTAIDAILNGGIWVSVPVNAHLLNCLLRRQRSSTTPIKTPGLVASLSRRELEVLEKIGQGKTTKEIAFELELSPRTVDVHRASIKKKLGLRSGAEIVAFAIAKM